MRFIEYVYDFEFRGFKICRSEKIARGILGSL